MALVIRQLVILSAALTLAYKQRISAQGQLRIPLFAHRRSGDTSH
jgi:hypothetical protein